MDLAQRPPYDSIDFKALARKDDTFRQIWQRASGKLDFQNPETVQALSKAILKSDFGLELDVPNDRLCPPIPNRWNYVAWMQGLVDSTSPDYFNKYDPNRQVHGLDIGTGTSAIYTMLCLRSRPKWSMCATDIDKKSFDSAARNLALNNLMTRTKLLQTTALTPLIPLAALGITHLDFVMCNPPFFNNTSEMQASLRGEGKSSKPNAVCTGSENEMVFAGGGDVGFVTAILNESLQLKEKVQWYSSLFGKLDSAKAIIRLLKQHGITNWAVGALEVGSSTKRWIVAWSFGDLRPRNVRYYQVQETDTHPCLLTPFVPRFVHPTNNSKQSHVRIEKMAHEYLPFPTSYPISLPSSVEPQAAKATITAHMASLDLLSWTWDPASSIGIGEASQNVWSRAYRRMHERKVKEGVVDMQTEEGEGRSVKLAFRIRIVELAREVVVEWVRGRDQVLWESLCGLVHRHFKKT